MSKQSLYTIKPLLRTVVYTVGSLEYVIVDFTDVGKDIDKAYPFHVDLPVGTQHLQYVTPFTFKTENDAIEAIYRVHKEFMNEFSSISE